MLTCRHCWRTAEYDNPNLCGPHWLDWMVNELTWDMPEHAGAVRREVREIMIADGVPFESAGEMMFKAAVERATN